MDRQHIQAVIFDLDGTLLDHFGAAREAIWEVASARPGWAVGKEETQRRWHDLEVEYFTRYEQGEFSVEQMRRLRIRLMFGECDDVDADAMFADFAAAYARAWRPYPHMVEVLRRCQRAGVPVAILTNGMRQVQERKVAAIGIEDVPMFTTDEVPPKPSPVAFATVCAALGSAPERTLMIGDDPTKDIAGAKAAGLAAIRVEPDVDGGVQDVHDWLADALPA